MTDNTLSFVVSSGPKLQSDPQVRTLIRKHAMRNVASTRKRRLVHGRGNVGQLALPTSIPIGAIVGSESSSSPDEIIDSGTVISCTDADADTNLVGASELEQTQVILGRRSTACLPRLTADFPLSLGATPPSSAYEAVRSRFQVDLTELSMLTNFNVGQGTISVLAEDPSRLLTLLGYTQWSYVQFVPSRYGLSPCLTAATDCLLAKARGMLMPDKKNEAVEIRLHMIALRLLQDALYDEPMSSEVLCASQLLGLHALLNPSQDAAWSQHVHGSIRLIKHRTPNRFKSDFDKVLFAAHIGPIVFESLVGHKPCYLDEPRWMNIYQSSIHHSNSLTERSPLAVALRSQMIMLPRLWHDLENAVRGPELFNEEVQALLRARCRTAHQNFLSWTEDYKSHCMSMSLISPLPQELAIRRELYGTALECLMIVKRLLATICDDERQTLEIEAQALAQSLLGLQNQPSPKHSWLFAGHEVGVAQSIVLTREQWQGPFSYASEYEQKLASRTRYTTWAEKLRPSV